MIALVACALTTLHILVAPVQNSAAAPLLPDLIAWESGPPQNYMHDGQMDQSTIRNRVLYRYSQPIANIGDGPLELREETEENFVQDIYQRIYDSMGGVNESFVGTFPNAHPPYGHMFLVGIAEYRVRTVTSGNGAGPVVASQIKTSYGLYDYDDYNTSLQGAPATPQYNGSNQYLGISVGWADVYPSWFAGQYIDVTDVPDGQYWLEVEIDPNDVLHETNETNNLTRVLINLVVPDPLIMQGDYNNDKVVDAADYVVWRKTLGREVPRGSGADGDGNGVIEPADSIAWQRAFGTSAPGGGSTSVPEPAAGALLLVLGACCCTHRFRRD
jgi:Lysyl oxidase